MNKMYLVQRGKFNDISKLVINGDNYKDSLFGYPTEGLIYLDYMGAAEFEWGALPKSAKRMAKYKDEYKIFDSGLKSIGGVPLMIYCLEKDLEGIKEQIKDFLKEKAQVDKICSSYRTKEPIMLEYSMLEYFNKNQFRPHNIPNFWWDINNDWMMFLGATDRQNIFKERVSNYLNIMDDD